MSDNGDSLHTNSDSHSCMTLPISDGIRENEMNLC